MPRVINPEEYQQKRGEILDAAQRLMLTKGYERMSIQDILDELSVSKGAFYHYFDSKQDLLEGMVERMMQEAEKLLIPITQDPNLPALEKLEQFYGAVASWKSARKAFLIQILKVWYADYNAIVRQKMTQAGGKWMAPFMNRIFQQGVLEGIIRSDLDGNAAQVVIGMMISLGESIATEILALSAEEQAEEREARLNELGNLVVAYRRGIERVLGAPEGSIRLFDLDYLREWILEPDIPSVSSVTPSA